MNNYRDRYKDRNYNRRKKMTERIGFYSALSICLVAVGLAVWSTYTSVNDYLGNENTVKTSVTNNDMQVANDITGVTVVPTTELVTEEPTTSAASIVISETAPATELVVQITEIEPTQSVLQMILAVSGTLNYPLSNQIILQEYSEEAVLNTTLNDYRAHTGTDFKGKKGDDVFAMSDGEVEGIYYDEFEGQVLSIKKDNYAIHYCGIDNPTVEVGDFVEIGDKIGEIGEVPFEAALESHIHVEIKVNGQYCDPLTLISND